MTLKISGRMDNMTKTEPTAFSYIPKEGLTSEVTNITDLIRTSGARKNNTVINSSVMFSFGVLGNILALIVLKRSDCDQKRKLFYRMVAGLTVTDFCGIVATSPVVISAYVNETWVGGETMCKYFAFMMIFAGTGTMMIVCTMAIERLLCIRHPYLYYARLRKKHATFFVLGSWAVAALMASLPLMGFGQIILQYPYTWCFFDYYTQDLVDRGFNYLFALFAMTTITITVACNAVVLYTLYTTKMRGLSRNRNGNSRQFAGYSKRYAECQMAVLLIGITIVFTACYLPLMVRILLNQTQLIEVNLRTDLLMIRFASMNQILDPWVYILLRREVVWKVVSTVKSIFTNKKKEDITTVIDMENGRMYSHMNSSAGLLQNEHRNCCVFCFHCMFDPPQTLRRESQFSSFYGNYNRRSTLSPSSPTRKLNRNIANSITSTGVPALVESIGQAERFRYLATLKQESEESQETVTQQPSPSGEDRVLLPSDSDKGSS